MKPLEQVECPIISITNMTVRYKDSDVGLKDVNLSIQKGEFVSIVGTSGAGKTTLLNVIAGFIKPTIGNIEIKGSLGVVFQDHAVFPWMKVKQNIMFGLENMQHKEKEIRMTQILEMTGLYEQANQYPVQLSGGQLQRVGLGRALAPNPDILLLDEPFASVDMETRERLHTWLLSVFEDTSRVRTGVLVTHDVEEALLLSDRLLIINHGKLEKDMPVSLPRPRQSGMRYNVEFIKMRQDVAAYLKDNH